MGDHPSSLRCSFVWFTSIPIQWRHPLPPFPARLACSTRPVTGLHVKFLWTHWTVLEGNVRSPAFLCPFPIPWKHLWCVPPSPSAPLVLIISLYGPRNTLKQARTWRHPPIPVWSYPTWHEHMTAYSGLVSDCWLWKCWSTSYYRL